MSNLPKYTTLHLTSPTLLKILALSITNILLSLTRLVYIYLQSLLLSHSSALLYPIPQLPVPLLPLSFTPNLITVIPSTINSPSLNYPVSSRPRTVLLVLSFKLLSPVTHITPILRSLHLLRITERIKYKPLSLTYKVLTTTQPPYLHNLMSVQGPRSTRSSSVVTLARPPSSSSLKITELIAPFVMLHSVSGINSLYLFVNLILVPVPPFPTHLFIYSSLLPLLIHHSAHPLLPLCFTPGLKPTCFTNPTPIVSLLSP